MEEFNLKPIPTRKRKRAERQQAEKSKDCAYIYLIENRNVGTVKVGRSVRPLARIRGVGTSKGAQTGEVAFLGWITVSQDVAPRFESGLHKKWEVRRVDGEWFDLAGVDLLSEIASCAKEFGIQVLSVAGLTRDVEPEKPEWTDKTHVSYRPRRMIAKRIG